MEERVEELVDFEVIVEQKSEEMAYGFCTDENKHDSSIVGVVSATQSEN